MKVMFARKYARTNPGVPGMIHEQVRSRPKAIAISSVLGQLTYGQLAALANRVRQRLHMADIGNGDVIAICLPPSPEFIAAALAIMSAGAAYLPLYENCPAERLLFMVADSAARLLITTSRFS